MGKQRHQGMNRILLNIETAGRQCRSDHDARSRSDVADFTGTPLARASAQCCGNRVVSTCGFVRRIARESRRVREITKVGAIRRISMYRTYPGATCPGLVRAEKISDAKNQTSG